MIGALLKSLRGKAKLAVNEPIGPVVNTKIPGPESMALLNDYEGLTQSFQSVRFFVDYNKSHGNYVADADGNMLLDSHPQSSSLPLGYNSPDLISYFSSQNPDFNVLHRLACNKTPTGQFISKIESVLLTLAPENLFEVFNACGCSHGAVENAIKAVFLWKHRQVHGVELTDLQLQSAMKHEEPGTPKFSILSFSGSYHGKFFGGIEMSNLYKPLYKDMPSFKWPVAPFPALQYPSSKQEEEKALSETEKILKSSEGVAGMIIEPVQIESGVHFASAEYYQALQKMCKDNRIAFIVNESDVGVYTTGKTWSHQVFGLSPDVVIVGGNVQFGAYFTSKEFRPAHKNQLSSTWCGDPLRMQMLQGIISAVGSHSLLDNVNTVGTYLVNGLQSVPGIKNVRGIGLNVAFDFEDKKSAWNYCGKMLEKGVNTVVVNEKTISVRPALVFTKDHADLFLQASKQVLG